jgi:hypothetical protein
MFVIMKVGVCQKNSVKASPPEVGGEVDVSAFIGLVLDSHALPIHVTDCLHAMLFP